jgi:hypothetical protein
MWSEATWSEFSWPIEAASTGSSNMPTNQARSSAMKEALDVSNPKTPARGSRPSRATGCHIDFDIAFDSPIYNEVQGGWAPQAVRLHQRAAAAEAALAALRKERAEADARARRAATANEDVKRFALNRAAAWRRAGDLNRALELTMWFQSLDEKQIHDVARGLAITRGLVTRVRYLKIRKLAAGGERITRGKFARSILANALLDGVMQQTINRVDDDTARAATGCFTRLARGFFARRAYATARRAATSMAAYGRGLIARRAYPYRLAKRKWAADVTAPEMLRMPRAEVEARVEHALVRQQLVTAQEELRLSRAAVMGTQDAHHATRDELHKVSEELNASQQALLESQKALQAIQTALDQLKARRPTSMDQKQAHPAWTSLDLPRTSQPQAANPRFGFERPAQSKWNQPNKSTSLIHIQQQMIQMCQRDAQLAFLYEKLVAACETSTSTGQAA